MMPHIIENIFSYVFNFANRFASGKYWYLKMAVLGYILTLLFSFPNYNQGEKWMREGINKQIEQPFTYHDYPPESHLAKRTFRITMPLIGKLLNLNITGLLILQSFFGFLFFILISKLVFAITSDKVLSFIICLGFTVVYVGKACFIDGGLFDGTAFFLLIIAMCFRNSLLIFFCVFLACYTDERAFISSFMLILWWILNENNYKNIKIRDIIIPNRFVRVVLLSIFAVFVTRLYLQHLFYASAHIVELSDVGFATLKSQLNIVLFGLFSGIEFFWILIFAGALVLFQYKKFMLLFGYMALITSIIITASIVADQTRSIAYIFPMVFIALKIVYQDFSQSALRKLLLTIVFISFLFGTYDVVGPKVWWIFPLPVQLLTAGQ